MAWVDKERARALLEIQFEIFFSAVIVLKR
jgi:hypothetical protein